MKIYLVYLLYLTPGRIHQVNPTNDTDHFALEQYEVDFRNPGGGVTSNYNSI